MSTEPTVSRAELAKAVDARQFFALAFGTIVGVGWVVYLGYWLELAGPLGAIVGFAAGTAIIVIIGMCYAEMAGMFPVSGGEVAYTYETYGARTAFVSGWLLALVYTAVTTWEAISISLLAENLIPGIRGPELYTVAGEPVYLGTILVGLSGMVFFTYLNYRGVKGAARVQELLTAVFLILCSVFIIAGLGWGETENLRPFFQRSATGSILPGVFAALITAPFFLAGFDTVPQVMEEKADGTALKTAVTMIVLAIGAAGIFYCLIILSSSMVVPWQDLLDVEQLPAVVAFERAFGSPILAKTIVIAAMLGLITTWNAVFIAASRVVFSLSRGHMIPPVFSSVHSGFGSPTVAVLLVGMLGSVGVFLGRGAIGPIVNMSVICFSIVYLLVCLAVILLRRRRPNHVRPYLVPGGNLTAALGVVGSLFVLVLTLRDPYVNARGGFPLEWTLLLIGIGLGLLFWIVSRRVRSQVSDEVRKGLILGPQGD